MTKIAVYPGSFDPITNGHLSLVRRALQIFDEIIVAVAINYQKKPLFTLEERVDMISKAIEPMKNVRVGSFNGLLVDYARKNGSNVVIKGLRALSDFEYEFQMALMNRRLNRNVQSLFLMTDYKWFYISSTIIKEAASVGGSIDGLVPPYVCQKLKEKFGLSGK
jgi:pantetheine-phosphate adenylyltransferase